MSGFKVLLWDIDGTLLDFLAAEKVAIRNCFEIFNLGECTDEMISRYSEINKKYWEALERGELSKLEVLVGRFQEFFEQEGIDVTVAPAFNDEYQIRLGDTCVFKDDSYNLVNSLKGRILQCGVTNGTAKAQERKLKVSGLGDIFDEVFISDKIGYEKPTLEFFAPVFSWVKEMEIASMRRCTGEAEFISKDEILIIGDSLTSDIKGGNNVGIKTCWYNPTGAINNKGVSVDYEIDNLQKILEII